MRSGMIKALTALLAGAGVALAQAPSTPAPARSTQSTLPAPTPAVSNGAPVAGGVAVDAGAPGCPGSCNGHANGGTDFDSPDGCPLNTFWFRPEYLLWHIPNGTLPPAQTVVPFSVSGIPNFQNSFGLGNGNIDYGARNGFRLNGGAWFDSDMTVGVDANFFQLERHAKTLAATSTANLPANFTTTVVVTVGLVSTNVIEQATVPFQLNTNLSVTSVPAEFWGYEANVRTRKAYIGPFCYDMFGGFRSITFREEMNLQENIQLLVGNPIPFTVPPDVTPPLPTGASTLATIAQISTQDVISTRNEFYGAQVGMSFEWWVLPSLVVTGYGKAAVGGTWEKIFIQGNTTTSSFAVVTNGANPPVILSNPLVSRNTTAGGLLTPGIGRIEDATTRLAWLPEGNLTVGYLPACWVKLFCGYNWLYISNVVRPGDQIGFTTSNANITLVGNSQNATLVQPGYRYQTTNLFVHGLTAGVEFRW